MPEFCSAASSAASIYSANGLYFIVLMNQYAFPLVAVLRYA